MKKLLKLKLDYIKAAREGNIDKVKECIDLGVPIDCFSNGALLESCYFGHITVVHHLMKNNIDIHTHNGLAAAIAIEKGHSSIFEYLVRKGVEPKKVIIDQIPHVDCALENITDYLIDGEMYIVHALQQNKREIIEWTELYIERTELVRQMKRKLPMKKNGKNAIKKKI